MNCPFEIGEMPEMCMWFLCSNLTTTTTMPTTTAPTPAESCGHVILDVIGIIIILTFGISGTQIQ